MTASVPEREAAPAVEQRLAELLRRMTIDEKIAQLLCPFAISWPGGRPPAGPDGLGAVAYALSATGLPPAEGVRALAELQRTIVATSRLGIPALFSEEALCGLGVRGATMFPDAIGQAATWDCDLVEEMAGAIGRQMRASGVHQALSPLCDVAIDPRWGRIEETYGEDPYLVGSLATAFVRGLQASGTIATLKHFVAYSASDGGRNTDAVHVGPRDLHELYGLPFEMAIRLGGARAVMCAYHAIDRVPVQASRELLTGLLRGEYGFDGILLSDLDSVEHLVSRHGVAPDRQTAVRLALTAGLDMELGSGVFTEPLRAALRAGQVGVAELDRAVSHVVSEKLRLGLFEAPPADPPESLDTSADRELARRVAAESIVLLRNEPVDGRPLLPIAGSLRSIAVLGPNADRPMAMLGNYSYVVLGSAIDRLGGNADDAGRPDESSPPDASRPGSRPEELADAADQRVFAVPVVTVLAGIRALAGPDVSVRYARGCPVQAAEPDEIQAAVALARDADLAVVVVGDQSGLITAATVGEGVDGAGLGLPGRQRELVSAVLGTGTPTVVVLVHGRPFVLDWLAEQAPAIVSAFFPGEAGGTAIADVLFGRCNPSGKLPVSFPRHPGVQPAPYHRPYLPVTSYFDTRDEPVFCFGHGLSYTRFHYHGLAISPTDIPAEGGVVEVSLSVTNVGAVPGREVVQLYSRDPVARTVRPRRELKGFAKLALVPGQTARVHFSLAAERFALYDPGAGWVVEPGRIELSVGSSSADIRLTGSLSVTGPTAVHPPTGRSDRALHTRVRIQRT